MDTQNLLIPAEPQSKPQPSDKEIGACRALPDLRDRIQDLGLTAEYVAFRNRYQAWRRGEHQGARGECGTGAAQRGFGYWYPSEELWSWRRTLSYWIAVCFFQGSVFFTVSSFLFCYPKALGPYKEAVTTFGYVAGKIHFIIGTYLMCIETINLHITELKPPQQPRLGAERVTAPMALCDRADQQTIRAPPALPPAERAGDVADQSSTTTCDEKARFHYWPFRYKTALANLEHVGAGPWPYYASVVYFIGVLIFGAGLVVEFVPMSSALEYWLQNSFYSLGSLCFVLGGICECIENGVFNSLRCDTGWWGALLNFLGSVGFLAGSILGFFHLDYASSFVFGLGSFTFVLGSAIVIVMWKDEQFGLTFLAALNNLGATSGRPVVVDADHRVEEVKTFSARGAAFVMVYCMAAAVSVYNFLTALVNVGNNPAVNVEHAFDALMPCIFSHLLLGLNAAVVETPKKQPFHLLYISCRWVALFMIANGVTDFVATLIEANRKSDA